MCVDSDVFVTMPSLTEVFPMFLDFFKLQFEKMKNNRSMKSARIPDVETVLFWCASLYFCCVKTSCCEIMRPIFKSEPIDWCYRHQCEYDTELWHLIETINFVSITRTCFFYLLFFSHQVTKFFVNKEQSHKVENAGNPAL